MTPHKHCDKCGIPDNEDHGCEECKRPPRPAKAGLMGEFRPEDSGVPRPVKEPPDEPCTYFDNSGGC